MKIHKSHNLSNVYPLKDKYIRMCMDCGGTIYYILEKKRFKIDSIDNKLTVECKKKDIKF